MIKWPGLLWQQPVIELSLVSNILTLWRSCGKTEVILLMMLQPIFLALGNVIKGSNHMRLKKIWKDSRLTPAYWSHFNDWVPSCSIYTLQAQMDDLHWISCPLHRSHISWQLWVICRSVMTWLGCQSNESHPMMQYMIWHEGWDWFLVIYEGTPCAVCGGHLHFKLVCYMPWDISNGRCQ